MAESLKVKFKKNGKVVVMAKSVAEVYVKKGRVEVVKEGSKKTGPKKSDEASNE